MSDTAILEVAYGAGVDTEKTLLPLASDGVQRIVWHMQYCDILIEVRDYTVWVNGARIEPAPEELRQALLNEHERIK